jgi:hypothetical protein
MSDEQKVTPGQVPEETSGERRSRPPRQESKVDKELYDRDLQFLLNEAPVELGERSILAGQIAALERGGAGGGVPNTDPYSDAQLGWGKHLVGTVERARRLTRVWNQLSPETQRVLTAHYVSRGRAAEVRCGIEHNWESVSGALGQVALVAVWILSPGELAVLVRSCMDKGARGRVRIINEATKRATTAVREAHRAWRLTKDLVEGRCAAPAA